MPALSPVELINLLETRRYGVEYQPIVSIDTQEIVAYEALARFYDGDEQAIRPDRVYSALHDSPISLFEVEFQQKRLQLQHAPNDKPVFVNLDQDSYFASGIQGPSNPFLKLFAEHKDKEIIVELIENSELNDAIMSLSMIDNMSQNGLTTAIDDVFNPQCMISTSVIQMVNYIKLDKHVIANQNNDQFLLLVKMMIDYAHQSGKQVILEGIETESDLQFARKLQVDFVQGFMYRTSFINVRPN